MARPELRPQDHTLLAVNDLALRKLLLPSSDWQIRPDPFIRLVPGRLRAFVKAKLLRIVGVTGAVRCLFDRKPKGQLLIPGVLDEPVPDADQLDYICEMTDVIFQLMPDGLRHRYWRKLKAEELSKPAGYVLLAVYAKQLAERGGRPLLRQAGDRIAWLKDNHRSRLKARAA